MTKKKKNLMGNFVLLRHNVFYSINEITLPQDTIT